MSIRLQHIPDNWGVHSNYGSPIVSIVLTAYNQEILAVEALQSLFLQDYPNLEIIISDDASPDNTCAELLKECEKQIEHNTPHKIILNRNNENLGLVKNYETGFRLATGELIIAAGGDDISYPHRVKKIVDEWNKGGRKATVIFHGLRPVNLDGTPTGWEWWKPTLRNPLGAAMAYSRVVIDRFPTISIQGGTEDAIFGRRAFLFGDILNIEEKLIDYRVGSGASTTGQQRHLRIKISQYMVESTIQNRLDIDYVKNSAPQAKIEMLNDLIDELSLTYSLENQMITGRTLLLRLKAFHSYIRREYRIRPRTVRSIILYYIPMMIPGLQIIKERILANK